MKKGIMLFITVLLFSAAGIYAQEKAESLVPKFNPAADPFSDLKTAIADAGKTDKRILLDVGGEWCPWCHLLDAFFEANPDLKKFMHDNFVVLKINYSKENKNEKFLAQYPKVDGYPHIFILEKDGKLLKSKSTGELEKGKSYDADKIMTFLKEWIVKGKS